jgi:hypothetical protein
MELKAMENTESTGVANLSVKLSVDELGAINNLMDRQDLEKLIVRSKSWTEVCEKIVSTGLFRRVNGNSITRILLLAYLERTPFDAFAAQRDQAAERKETIPTTPRSRDARLRPERS